MQGMIKTFPLFAFLQQFVAGENLKVARNSAGRRYILTTMRESTGLLSGRARD